MEKKITEKLRKLVGEVDRLENGDSSKDFLDQTVKRHWGTIQALEKEVEQWRSSFGEIADIVGCFKCSGPRQVVNEVEALKVKANRDVIKEEGVDKMNKCFHDIAEIIDCFYDTPQDIVDAVRTLKEEQEKCSVDGVRLQLKAVSKERDDYRERMLAECDSKMIAREEAVRELEARRAVERKLEEFKLAVEDYCSTCVDAHGGSVDCGKADCPLDAVSMQEERDCDCKLHKAMREDDKDLNARVTDLEEQVNSISQDLTALGVQIRAREDDGK